jgi:hypothetical protein
MKLSKPRRLDILIEIRWVSDGTRIYVCTHINAVANNVMLLLYLRYDFYYIIFKIKHIIYSLRFNPPSHSPLPRKNLGSQLTRSLILSCPWVRQLSRYDVPADVGLLCDKAAVLGDMKKGTYCSLSWPMHAAISVFFIPDLTTWIDVETWNKRTRHM